MTKTEILKIAPQLSQRPNEITLLAFDGFEVITQGDDGALLSLLRLFLELSEKNKNPISANIKIFIDKFEKGVLTLAVRACDTKKPNCEKMDDGSLTFPGPLNHMAIHYNDYLNMGKAWNEILRYIKGAEYKFSEDERRINEAMAEKKDDVGKPETNKF